MLAKALMGLGRPREALPLFRKLDVSNDDIMVAPERLRAHLACARQLGMAAEARRVEIELRAAYATLYKKDMNGPESEAPGLTGLEGPRAIEAMNLAFESTESFTRGDFRASAEKLRAALRLRPDYAGAHFRLARALDLLNDPKGASREMALAAHGDNALVRERAQSAIARGVGGTDYRPTLSPEHQRQWEARQRAEKVGRTTP